MAGSIPAFRLKKGRQSFLNIWLLLGLWPSFAGMIVGVILLDFAVQAALVSNQHIVFVLQPDSRARLNTLFMTAMFLGGATGSTLAMLAWRQGGWSLALAAGLMLCGAAILLQAAAHSHHLFKNTE